MIDIHTHIMPGVDDGASNYQMAIQMLQNAAAGGTTDVFLTPHCAPSYGFFNANDERLASCFKRLCYEVVKRGIQVRLHPGMEILFEGKQEFLYQKEDYYPLCGSRYYLIEHYFNVTDQVFLEGIESVMEIGGIPIVAHPERYEAIQEDCLLRNGACIRKAAEMGALFQVNKGSLMGKHGVKSLHTAVWLLEQELVDFIASDAHHPKYRNAGLRYVEQEIREKYGEARAKCIFEENPRKVIEDKPIIRRQTEV